ncbi:MAG: hypothetical protein ACJ8BW_14710 [Ktedonobacteraceae bacterium]
MQQVPPLILQVIQLSPSPLIETENKEASYISKEALGKQTEVGMRLIPAPGGQEMQDAFSSLNGQGSVHVAFGHHRTCLSI